MADRTKTDLWTYVPPVMFFIFLAAWVVSSTVTTLRKPVSQIFLAGAVLFLIITLYLFRTRLIPFFKSRRTKYGSNMAVQIIVLAAILVTLNYIAARHYKRFDWTSTGRYTLSEKTKKVVEGLEDELKVTTFLMEDELDADYGQKVRDLLISYEALSDKLRIEHFDQHRDPARAEILANKYKETALENSVVFEYRERVKSVPPSEVVEYDYSGMQYGAPPRMMNFKGEQAFTSAILNVLQERQTRAYFLTGHGEKDTREEGEDGLAAAQRLLLQENMLTETLTLARTEAVPEDCDVLIVAGPTVRLLDQEFERIQAYLDRGGRLMILLDPLTETGFESFLAPYGVDFGEGVAIDPSQTMLFASAANVFVTEYGESEITRVLKEKGVVTSFFLSRPVGISEENNEQGMALTELAMTTSEGWTETSLEKEVAFDEGEDVRGPVTLAVSLTRTLEGPEAAEEPVKEDETEDQDETREMIKIVLFGDSDFAANYGLSQVGNADLFMNTVNWLADKKELVSIGPKPAHFVNLSLSNVQMKFILWLTVVGLPLLSVILGASIWYARRQ